MKSKKYARIIMGCCLMILIGCHNKNLETPIEPTVILEKTNPYPEILKLDDDIYSFQPLLEEIARYIAKNRHLITDNLANKMLAAPVMLSELDPAKKFPASVIESDGTPYEIGVELFINSTLNGKPLRVAIDPDRFYSQKPSFPVFVFDRSKKVIRVEDIYINSSDDMVPYPLAFVTLEDRTEISWEEIRKNSKIYKEYGLVGNSREHPQKQFGKSSRVQSVTSSVIDYLAITNVRLFVELDGATKEEFEIYIREGSNFNDPVNRTTDHLFNGKWHEDAARNSRFYVDVNNKNTTYSFSPSIALWPLSNSTPTALAMIEDDRTSGKHKQPSSSSPITVTFLEEYRRSTQAVYYNVDRKMNIFEGGYGDADDIYKKGMFSDWTIDNTPAEPNLAIVTLGDLKIWLQKYTPPPPPPPAPTLQGSVYQFSAKLTWNAVAEADHYKITLDDTYDNQILTFTTTANQYIDWPRSPVVLTGSSSMPYLRYTVKTVTADNRESNPSNSIYFNYEVQ